MFDFATNIVTEQSFRVDKHLLLTLTAHKASYSVSYRAQSHAP